MKSYLIATASVLKLARIESMVTAEEIVDLTGLDVVREARDEECVDLLLQLGIDMNNRNRRKRTRLMLKVVRRVEISRMIRWMKTAGRRRRHRVRQGSHVVGRIIEVGQGG